MKTKVIITPTQVKVITYAIAFLGLFSELGRIFIAKLSPTYYLLAQNLNLSLLEFEIYNPSGWRDGTEINLLNLIFYLLLFTGTIIYTISKGKETKLIRFVISVVLFSNVWFLILNVFSQDFAIMLLFATKNIIIIGLAYWVLEGLNQTKELNITYVEEPDKRPIFTPIKALNEERLVHYIVDTLIISGIFFNILIKFKIQGAGLLLVVFRFFYYPFSDYPFSNVFDTTLANFLTGLSVIAVISTLYYTFFEAIFGATPAKFLTETRVTDDMNGKTAIGTFFRRSCYRYIPMNTFSFLFAKTGWHDSLSETIVVREKRTGVNGLRYLLVIPIVIIFFFVAKTGEKYHMQHLINNKSKDINNK